MAETAAGLTSQDVITWRRLVFSDPRPGSEMMPFVVWEATRNGTTAAGSSPAQARARLDGDG